jgi:hypothetical protein
MVIKGFLEVSQVLVDDGDVVQAIAYPFFVS